MQPSPGLCASCGTPGPVGSLCETPVCAARMRRAIPRGAAESYLGGRTPEELLGCAIGEWLIVGHVGVGGISEVYRALRMPRGQVEGALKLLKPMKLTEQQRFVDKLRGEAEALARIHDPNVVTLFDYGTFEQRPYLVTRYVRDAVDLQTQLEKDPLDLAEGVDVLRQCVDGLAAAHARDVIHRDIKPGNIMLQRRASGGLHVVLIDFGLAKDLAQSAMTSVAIGTPRYMAPEQLREGGHVGPWTDWYALTTIAFTLLLGEKAYDGFSSHEIMLLKLRQSFDPVGPILDMRGAGPATRRFFARGLATEPAVRFQRAEDFRAALNAVLGELTGAPLPEPLASDPALGLEGETLVEDAPPDIGQELVETVSDQPRLELGAQIEQPRLDLGADPNAETLLGDDPPLSEPPLPPAPTGEFTVSLPSAAPDRRVLAAVLVSIVLIIAGLVWALTLSPPAAEPAAPDEPVRLQIGDPVEAPDPASE